MGQRSADFAEKYPMFSELVTSLVIAEMECGVALFGRNFPPHYLTESANRFVKPPEFMAKLESLGFQDVRVRKLMLGVIVIYSARKP